METTTTSSKKNKRGEMSDSDTDRCVDKKKQLRLDSAEDFAPMMSLNLSSDELQGAFLGFMVKFLHPCERWKLAQACRCTNRLVEYYSELTLKQLAQQHGADGTFFSQLREDHSEGVEVPHRYLLEKAKSTYLYKLDMMPGFSVVTGRGAFSTTTGDTDKRETRLVVAGTQPLYLRPPFGDPNWPPIFIYTWNVGRDKCLINRIEVPSEEREYSFEGIFWMADMRRIVTVTNRRILVFSAEEGNMGDMLHTYSESIYIQACAQVDVHTIVFLDYRTNRHHHSKLRLFDIRTGETHILTQLVAGSICTIRAVCNNRWIMLDEDTKLRVLDMEKTCQEACFLRPGLCTSLQYARDDDDVLNTFYHYDDHTFRILKLNGDSGQLYFESSVELHRNGRDHLLGKSGNHMFFEVNRNAWLHRRDDEDDDTDNSAVEVVTVLDGTVTRTLKLPPNLCCDICLFNVHSNGAQIFLGLEPFGPNSAGLPGTSIAAYLAHEHY